MKGILVVDKMPERCIDCPLYNLDGMCLVTKNEKEFSVVYSSNFRIMGCPLKPIPDNTMAVFFDGELVDIGYPKGIEAGEILGEENG